MEKEIKSSEKETYISPNIEIVDIVTEQNILQAGSGDSPDMDGLDW